MDSNLTITRGNKSIVIDPRGNVTGLKEMLGDEIPIYIDNRLRFEEIRSRAEVMKIMLEHGKMLAMLKELSEGFSDSSESGARISALIAEIEQPHERKITL